MKPSSFLRFRECGCLVLLAFAIGFAPLEQASAANYGEAEQLFLTGEIDKAQEIASGEVERGIWNRRWSELLIRCQMIKGEYSQALETYEVAVKRYPTSLPLRELGVEVAQFNQLPGRAAAEKASIESFLNRGQLKYATTDTLVAAGRFFSENGIDARIILKSFFDRVLESDPAHREALVATAQLAISKGDFQVASQTVQKAMRREVDDARLDYLMAVSLMGSDPPAANQALETSLEKNPKLISALVLKAEQEIDRERHDLAEATLDEILEINAKNPSALALKAVIAHVEGRFDDEKAFRTKALSSWNTNPEVDHLIGRKLSDKYRFAEGAAYQRRALIFAPKHVPATFQLAQDLLRLGDEKVGWQLAERVNADDPYNVVAFNLMTLKDRIDGFETLSVGDEDALSESGVILIRMDPKERRIYGNAVAELLEEAKRVLCEKYELELKRPVVVEIFPKQSDFAIRTFGLPGGDGFLGVCFGQVVTANSPASQGARPSNWKSVLWHEFCHVITLTKTNNRMPRWLSEGISVYEERLKNPAWGQSMTAGYREMILGDDLTPISQLSGAFLNPPSPNHLQFAYYESSLVVQFLVEKHGIEALNQILDTLADGIPINAAIASSVGPLERLEVQFREYVMEAASEFGSELAFDREDFPDPPERKAVLDWALSKTDNYWGSMTVAKSMIQKGQFDEAAELLEQLREKGAATGEREGVLELLAKCYDELELQEQERDVILEIMQTSSDALPSLVRFIEMEKENEDWESVKEAAGSALAIQPLSIELQQVFADACRELGEPGESISALNAIQAMDPIDVAAVDFRLAEAFYDVGDVQKAREHCVDALLVAPRYREAYRLLREMDSREKEAGKTPGAEPGKKTGAEPDKKLEPELGKEPDSGGKAEVQSPADSDSPVEAELETQVDDDSQSGKSTEVGDAT